VYIEFPPAVYKCQSSTVDVIINIINYLGTRKASNHANVSFGTSGALAYFVISVENRPFKQK